MKGSELKRKTRLQANPAKPLRRTVKIRAKNPKRRESEFARTYHSRERVAWVKSLPCLVCAALGPIIAAVAGPSDNAHVETDGAGRKADYDRIVPLCRNHHRRYDEHRKPFDAPEARQAVKDAAAKIEQLWQDRLTRSGRTAA